VPVQGCTDYLMLLEGSQTSTVCPCGKTNVLKQVSVERWYNDSDREKINQNYICVTFGPYRAVNTLRLGNKTSRLMLYREI